MDRVSKKGAEGSSLYLSLHKYCRSSDIFIPLRDNGELIGRQTLSLLNSVHAQQKALLVASHYLLDLGSPFIQL